MGILIEPANINFLNARAFFTTKIPANKNQDILEVLAEIFNILKDSIYLPIQKHTNTVYVLNSQTKPVVADAVVTDRKNVLIGILVADCVPILLYDVNKRVIGAVHAGWRGTTKKILKNTIKIMQERFRCLSKDISVAIGPSIRQCSYEVGEDVKTKLREATGEGNYYSSKNGKSFVDLSSANKIQALSMGILQENIWHSEECTFCNPRKFYSHRYTKGCEGRQGGFIVMW